MATKIIGEDTITFQRSAVTGFVNNSNWSGTDLSVANGGTGASTVSGAQSNLGLVAGGSGDIWVEKAGDTMTGPLTLSHSIPTITAGAITLNYATSQSFLVNLTSNITSITISGAPASGTYGEIIIQFLQDGTGGRTVSGWPTSVNWPSATSPTITTTATVGTDFITLRTTDGGTNWYGDFSQDYR